MVSFGFVFIHPFMDGNGRLSRWLFHYSLCRSGRLKHGAILLAGRIVAAEIENREIVFGVVHDACVFAQGEQTDVAVIVLHRLLTQGPALISAEHERFRRSSALLIAIEPIPLIRQQRIDREDQQR